MCIIYNSNIYKYFTENNINFYLKIIKKSLTYELLSSYIMQYRSKNVKNYRIRHLFYFYKGHFSLCQWRTSVFKYVYSTSIRTGTQ